MKFNLLFKKLIREVILKLSPTRVEGRVKYYRIFWTSLMDGPLTNKWIIKKYFNNARWGMIFQL